MLTHADARAVIDREIHALLLEHDQAVDALRGDDLLTDLGLNSLQLARLVIALEAEFGADPFATGEVSLAEARSVDEVTAAYVQAAKAEVAAKAVQ
jgi:acyl carrier protein